MSARSEKATANAMDSSTRSTSSATSTGPPVPVYSDGVEVNFGEYLKEHRGGLAHLKRWLCDVYAEDLGEFGDVTSLATIPVEKCTEARFLIKQHGIIAGIQVAQWITQEFLELYQKTLPPGQPEVVISLSFDVADGQIVSVGQHIGCLRGSAHFILLLERTVLNVMQRMSGIASQTNRMVTLAKRAAEGTGESAPNILDTRKTAPGLRLLDKLAVRIGGGRNHRFGLYDMVLIKGMFLFTLLIS